MLKSKIMPISKQALADEVGDRIEALIFDGSLRPGERINESKLSEMLQVSRSPIREACRRLESVGLVENIANRGSFVRIVSPVEGAELYDIRAELASYAARTACSRATATDLEELRSVVEEMRDTAKSGDVSKYFDINRNFHHFVIALAKNSSLLVVYEGIWKKLGLFQMATLAVERGLDISYAQHLKVAEAILERDAETAANEARAHVMSAKFRAAEILALGEDN